MNIVPLFGIGMAVCIALSGCAGLVPMPKLEGCYPLDNLSVLEQAALHVGRGNPILLIGGKKFVCTCYDSSLTIADEQGALDTVDEKGALGKADENGSLSKADENGSLSKADENSALDKVDENGSLSKADEQDALSRADENSALDKADEKGKAAQFSCRVVPECPGFQLIGYGPKEITVLTPAGQKSVTARCITW